MLLCKENQKRRIFEKTLLSIEWTVEWVWYSGHRISRAIMLHCKKNQKPNIFYENLIAECTLEWAWYSANINKIGPKGQIVEKKVITLMPPFPWEPDFLEIDEEGSQRQLDKSMTFWVLKSRASYSFAEKCPPTERTRWTEPLRRRRRPWWRRSRRWRSKMTSKKMAAAAKRMMRRQERNRQSQVIFTGENVWNTIPLNKYTFPSDKAVLKSQFVLFSKFGDKASDGETIKLSQSDKWFKQVSGKW